MNRRFFLSLVGTLPCLGITGIKRPLLRREVATQIHMCMNIRSGQDDVFMDTYFLVPSDLFDSRGYLRDIKAVSDLLFYVLAYTHRAREGKDRRCYEVRAYAPIYTWFSPKTGTPWKASYLAMSLCGSWYDCLDRPYRRLIKAWTKDGVMELSHV